MMAIVQSMMRAATVAALTAKPGVYDIVDDDPLPVAEWLPAASEVRLSAGEEDVHFTRVSWGFAQARQL